MTENVNFNIEEKAINKIIELREQEPGEKDYALFLQVDGMQGNQFTYDLSFLDIKEARPEDASLKFGPLPVIIAFKDIEKFEGASLNLSEDMNSLEMDNPNTPSPNILETSGPLPELTGEFAEKVQTILDQQINPAIASHGGVAKLVNVDGKDIYLQLGGGCQGCGMAEVTLSQGIEASLREAIPEIGNIIDATDHSAGDDPYFAGSKK